MGKPLSAWLVALVASSPCLGADLTPTEMRWLQGMWPVVSYARAERLPLDIVVQPQPALGVAPLALAFIAGRCKLVLSMRGNPEAEATLERIDADLLAPALELMAAHELGHCRRYLDGAWHGLPAGFAPVVPETRDEALRAATLEMRAARREEGYADLVGLAWTQDRHPRHYARLHAWLVAERSNDLIEGSHHDTLAWLGPARLGIAPAGRSLFDRASVLWAAVLATGR